jgi:outer membrane protein, multidrug efflux system
MKADVAVTPSGRSSCWPRAALGRCVLFACAWLTAGCALIREDTGPAATIGPEQIRLADTIHLARDGWPSARWWTDYQDPQLDALITRAVEASPTLAVARSRVDVAASKVQLARSSTDLQVDFSALVDRTHVSDTGFLSAYATHDPALGADGPSYTTGTVGLNASLAVDLWGKERSEVEAAIGVANAARADEAEAELVVSTQVAELYFSVQTADASLALLDETRDLAAFALETHTARTAQGLEPKVPEEQARADLLAIERKIAATTEQIAHSREALRALLGGGSEDLLQIRAVALPTPVLTAPRTLSYELLARRPDLQALRWYVESSFARVDVAKAEFYPSFDIRAFFGFNSIYLSELFTHASQQINVVPGLQLPLFDGGRLNANLRGVRADSNTLIAQYNQAVLDAVRDVAQAGSGLESMIEQTHLQTSRVASVAFASDSTAALYQRGLADRLATTTSQQQLIAEKLSLVQLEGRTLEGQLGLVRALGGGYRSDSPVALSPR